MGRDRDRYRLEIEAVLTVEELATLTSMCVAYEVKAERWHTVPQIAKGFETIAVTRIAGGLISEDGLTKSMAFKIAASRCGLTDEAVRSRIKVA